ncbi:hypothetical protein QFC19_002899 [Naganishia cerealis]|uniref:Uncharacterized protein n=1 Tax=Naganishia cerealis TaxID=610337 RepID=A0ACC2W6U2_9TREE|nr:hypothetical protein QFC19_002899 [Naganishia cerealis]
MSLPAGQRLFIEDVPLLIPDDGNDYSYDTSVELSFFDAAPIPSHVHVYDAAEFDRSISYVPVRPLELKRRQDQLYSTTKRNSNSVSTKRPSEYQRTATESRQSTANVTPFRRIASGPSQVSPTNMHLGLERHAVETSYIGFSPESIGSPSGTDSESGDSTRCNDGGFSALNTSESPEDEEDHAPMTPSRAGAKALQLLGAYNMPTKPVKSPYAKPGKEHYRPFPTSMKQEIDSFFGFSPQTKSSSCNQRHNQSHIAKQLKQVHPPQQDLCTLVDRKGQVWKDEVEQEEFAGLLSHQQSEQSSMMDTKPRVAGLLPPIKLRNKASIERLSASRNSLGIPGPITIPHDNVSIVGRDRHNTWEEEEEDVFGSVGSLSRTATGITLASSRAKERISYNRQLSHPPVTQMHFLQRDPYGGTQSRTAPDFCEQAAVFRRKQPPPALTLNGRAPSALSKVVVEQIVSGRPSLPTTQLPMRTSSRLPTTAPQPSLPHTPFMAPRTAPVPPRAPKAPGRLPTRSSEGRKSEASDSSSPHTPSTPSPEHLKSEQSHHHIIQPAPTRGMSFFEDSPPPDQTHFRIGVNSKAAMREGNKIAQVVSQEYDP